MKTYFIAGALCLLSTVTQAHEWYTGLKAPNGVRCCDGKDCHPTGSCRTPDNKEGIISRWGCISIPWDKVLGIASPDGGPHICESLTADPSTSPVIYCVILGGQS